MGTKKHLKDTFASTVGLSPPFGVDVDAFENRYKKGFMSKNK